MTAPDPNAFKHQLMANTARLETLKQYALDLGYSLSEASGTPSGWCLGEYIEFIIPVNKDDGSLISVFWKQGETVEDHLNNIEAALNILRHVQETK